MAIRLKAEIPLVSDDRSLLQNQSSLIQQNADNILLRVAQSDFNGTNLVSLINLEPDTVKIQAKNIQLEGIVTVNSRFKILSDGSMEATNGTFNGSITATSGKIGRFDLNNNDLVYTSDLFNKDYDRSDLNKLHRVLLGLDPQTAYDLAVYDFNNSGTLSITDLVILDSYIQGISPLPTPLKRIRSIVRIGTNNGALITQAQAENGSLGPITTIRGEK